jgi:serine/arginine repetitive matrix protein 2
VQRGYNAAQGSTSAAAIAFLTGRPEGGGENLSSSAAAAALRSTATTPVPIGEIQTKRMQRRGSTSSFGSTTSNVRQPFSSFGGGPQRAPSRSGSMTDRSFRSPSPGGRKRISSISSDVPPLPTHNRGGSLDGPYRVSSPEPAPGARSMSVDRAARAPAKRAAPRGGLTQVPEDRETEDLTSYRQSNVNYSRPMSPTGSIRSVSSRPASASGYYYDPATRRLVGTPPAAGTTNPALKAARVSAQKAPPPQAYVPPIRQRPASVALPSPASKAAPTAAQLRAQHMRAGPPRTATRAPPPQVRPGSSMGRMQSSAVSSTTSLASNKPMANGTTAMNNTIASANKKRSSTLDSLSGPVTTAPRQSMQSAQASPAARPMTRAAPEPAQVFTSRAAPVFVSQPVKTPQPIKTNVSKQGTSVAPTSVPSPTHETLQSFHTRAAALLAGDSTVYSPAPQSPQQDRSFSQPVSNLAPGTSELGRTASVSPARSTRFSETPLLGQNLHHEPLPRSVSPSKSAMKPPSIRTLSPSGSTRHGYSDNEDVSQTRKKKSVRISLAEPEAVPAQSRNVSAPLIQKGPWTVTDETNMGPIPALPTFGSVRGRKEVIKPGRAPQRPLSNVYETDLAPGHHEAPTALQHESASIPEGEVNNGPVNGLGLGGVSQQTSHAFESEPELLSGQQIAGHDNVTNNAAPSIAVMPATPRAEEYLEEPSMVPGSSRAETQQQLPSITTHDVEEATDVDARPDAQEREPLVDHSEALSAMPTAQKQMFLPDLVSRLRPTSEMYDDRSFNHEDVPAVPSTDEQDLTSNDHTAPAQIDEHEASEAVQSQYHHNAAGDYATKDTPYTTSSENTGFPSAIQQGAADVALPSHANTAPTASDISTSAFRQDDSNSALPSYAENAISAVSPSTSAAHSEHGVEPLVKHNGPYSPSRAPQFNQELRTQTSTATEHFASPHTADLPPQVPYVAEAAAAHQVQVHDDDQPDDEDWDRVKSYWSSLSDTRKKQIEREAGLAPTAARSPPPIGPSLPAAPLPPWPDQQYQQSVARATPPQSQMPMNGNMRTLRGPEPGIGRPSSAQGLPGYGPPGYDRQMDNSMPRTMRGPPPGMGRPSSAQGQQGPGRPPMDNTMPRTMRGPDPGMARPQSAQGPPGSNRQPMYRNESSNGPNGPPLSNRPPMMRPGSSTGSLHGQPPLKSALKKTNAPIAIAPAAMQRTFSNSSDSDSSFRKERKRRRDAAAQSSGGRMSMRRSMRDDGPPDRMMSPTPPNGGGRMSMRGSMREQNAPTLRSGGSGTMRGSMRQSADDSRGGRSSGFAKPTKQQSMSQPNMFRSMRGGSSDEERTGGGGGGGGGGFRSRFADSDDEDYAPPSMPQNKTFFGSKNNTPNGASRNERAVTNGQVQGAALGAGTLRIGEQTTPVKAKRTGGFMSSSKKQTSFDVDPSASAPVTPARPQTAGSLFRRLSSSQNTPQRNNYDDYPPVPSMPDQYGGPSGTAVDKKGLTAEQIAAQMWQKQQKTGKSALPIVSQKTGKKKKFQGLRRILGIDD